LTNNTKEKHYLDSELAKELSLLFINEKAESVADFDCGIGHYVKLLSDNNINIKGYDGNPNLLESKYCSILNLSKEYIFEEPFDWIMSLEVGEHIPKQYEDIFINNLHKNNKYGIILSWAIIGQGGIGYVNEQNND
jgi:2-polyprenyl-3-methyl-5-hydroxy-6-metoxy-1,4-benzoquinol methylase